MGDTQLHLRWHSHNETFTDMLQELHVLRSFTDVSLMCQGGVVKAHKAVLSLSSPYLATVLATGRETDDVPLLLPEIPVQDVRYLICFIYRGQVDVPQQHIASFLNTGKHLHVHGLEQGDRLVESPAKSDELSNPSEPDEETQQKTSNNNIGERKNQIPEVQQAKVLTKPMNSLLKPEEIKSEVDLKPEKVEAPEEGKIDLNFYLQQAIQSASMPCPLCNKEFKSQSGLRDHIRLHTGERPFVCEFCHMNFARASHLKRHRRMHTGEKPFECSVCGKDFSRGDKLKDHIRRHEAENKLTQIRQQMLNLEDKEQEPLASNSGSFPPLPPSLLLVKSQSNLLPPPIKRQCISPPKHPMTLPTMSQGVVQNLISASQADTMSQMMGVTSIGECILRPIN